MKLLRHFLFLFIVTVSFSFFSCKTDNPVTETPFSESAQYDWTSQNITFGEMYGIQTIDRGSYFATTTAGLYKVNNGVPVLFTVHDTIFKARSGYVYDNSYIVYTGTKVSGGKPQFMVYDNGTYTIYDQPQSALAYLSPPVFASRGKFYCYLYDSLKYYKFDNGNITSYSFSGSYANNLGKANGNIYLFVRNANFSRTIYKITESGPVEVRTESNDDGAFLLNSDILKVATPGATVTYFTESGWTNMFDISEVFNNYPSVMRGNSRNHFAAVRQDSASRVQVNVWNGTNYIRQTNIPSSVNFNDAFFYSTSEFIDNTFYLLVRNNDNSSKVIKGTYKGQ